MFRHKFFRLCARICGFIAGGILAALGAAVFFISIGFSIYVYMGGNEPKLLIPIFAFLGVIGLLLAFLGVKIIRENVQPMRYHSLDGVDLDTQPWMANAEWRNRRIVHRIGIVPAVQILWILASAMLIGLAVLAVFAVPTSVLVTAVLISCGIVMVLGYLYWYLKEKNVVITPRDVVPLILVLPLIIIAPSALGLFPPATNKLLEVVAGVLMFSGIASIFVYLYLKKRKFGISVCHLKTLPAFIGGTLEAEIEIDFPKVKTGLPELPDGTVEAELQNVSSTGRSQIVNWRTKCTIPAHTVIRPGDGTLRIPVALEIPNEAREKVPRKTFWTGSAWKLEIRAPFPGVDYASWFIVPVYFPESEPSSLPING